jgi:hypothetical protein
MSAAEKTQLTQSQNWGWNSCGYHFRWDHQFGFCFCSFSTCVLFSSWFFYFIPRFSKTGAQYPQFGVLYRITLLWQPCNHFLIKFLWSMDSLKNHWEIFLLKKWEIFGKFYLKKPQICWMLRPNYCTHWHSDFQYISWIP